jgi:putative oxidoreductase
MRQVVMVMSGRSNVTHFILRLVTGIVLTDAGFLKVFKMGDLAKGVMVKYGVPIPELTGPFISFLEFFGGIALIIGLFTRYVGIIFTIEFIVTVLLKARVMEWPNFNGMWIDLMLIGACLTLASTGAGMLSVDRGRRWEI